MSEKRSFDDVVRAPDQGGFFSGLLRRLKRAGAVNSASSGSQEAKTDKSKIPGGLRKERVRMVAMAAGALVITSTLVTLFMMYNKPKNEPAPVAQAKEFTDTQETKLMKPSATGVPPKPVVKPAAEPVRPARPIEKAKPATYKPREPEVPIAPYVPVELEDPMVDAARKSGMFVAAGGADPSSTPAKTATRAINSFGGDMDTMYVPTPVQNKSVGGGTQSQGWGSSNGSFYDAGGASGVGAVSQIGPQTVAAGTIINAILVTEINSDLPGQILAQVSGNVYDTLTGQNLLIPAGSKMIAQYNSIIGWGQNRVQIGWSRLQRPDGVVVNLGNMLGTDARGTAGSDAEVDGHPFEYLAAMGFMIGTQLAVDEIAYSAAQAPTVGLQNLGKATEQSVSPAINQVGLDYLNRQMNRPATLRVKQGKAVALFVTSDLTLPVFKRN